VDEGSRSVDTLDGGDGHDGGRWAPIGPPPAARSVVQRHKVTAQVDLDPGDAGPPVGDETAAIASEPRL
jgi:hypothetical protein